MIGSTPSIGNKPGVTEPPWTRSALETSPLNTKLRRRYASIPSTAVAPRKSIMSRNEISDSPQLGSSCGCETWVGCNVIRRSVRPPNGIGRRLMPFTRLKIVILAPMPIASVSRAATRNPGFCRRPRQAWRRSRSNPLILPIYQAICHENRQFRPESRWDELRAFRREIECPGANSSGLLLRDFVALLREQRRQSVLAHKMRGADDDEATRPFRQAPFDVRHPVLIALEQ